MVPKSGVYVFYMLLVLCRRVLPSQAYCAQNIVHQLLMFFRTFIQNHLWYSFPKNISITQQLWPQPARSPRIPRNASLSGWWIPRSCSANAWMGWWPPPAMQSICKHMPTCHCYQLAASSVTLASAKMVNAVTWSSKTTLVHGKWKHKQFYIPNKQRRF